MCICIHVTYTCVMNICIHVPYMYTCMCGMHVLCLYVTDSLCCTPQHNATL